MSDISQEAHEALLKSAVATAVAEAVKTTEAALATKTTEAASAVAKVAELETANGTLQADNDRLNKELDTAQVTLKSATEEVASLKTSITEKDKAAELAEIASKRSEQVKNLGLFDDTYVAEKASKWAAIDEASWGEQLDEWKQLKPASTETVVTDAASAMSGTTENLTKEQQDTAAAAGAKPKARRAALGLV